MEKHEMMSLEDSGQLRDKMRFFEQELLKNHHIDPNLYVEYNVKRGLRDSAGKGVLTGLTEISDVNGYNLINGRQIPADGRLYYQGINVQDIIIGNPPAGTPIYHQQALFYFGVPAFHKTVQDKINLVSCNRF